MSRLKFKSNNQVFNLELNVDNSTAPKIFLIIIEIIISLLPIFGIILSLANDSFSPVILIGIAFYVAIVWFPFTRITFWSTAGRELINLYPDRIEYYYDYKFYKSKLYVIDGEDFKLSFINPIQKKDKEMGNLYFFISEDIKYISTLKISFDDFKMFESQYSKTAN